jgi:hypothetical protein
MSLLQPSVSVGRARKTQDQILQEARLQSTLQDLDSSKSSVTKSSSLSDTSGPVGTTWGPGRKSRKRRQLKAEKVLLDPKPVSAIKEITDSDSEDEDRIGVGDDTSSDSE